MKTELSNKKVLEMQATGPSYCRKALRHRHTFQTSADKLFSLICPTAEYDWIEGWHCELVYSQSLKQEYNAIFKTDFFNVDETWVISHFEPNRIIEIVRVSEHISAKIDVLIHDNLDGTTTGDWIVCVTALTEKGNDMVSRINPEEDPIGILIGALDHYIMNDAMLPLPDGVFNKK